MTRDARMAQLYRCGSTLQAIGGEYGITRERVRQLLEAAGVERRHATAPSPAAIDSASRLYRARRPMREVASALGRSLASAYDVMHAAGIERGPRPERPHGKTSRYDAGCRCPRCRAANTARSAAWVKGRQKRGLCQRCNRKRVNANHCERHRVEFNARLATYQRGRRAGVGAA